MTQKQLGPGPTGDTEVATKDYVDTAAGGIWFETGRAVAVGA